MSHRHEQLQATLHRAVQQVLARGLSDPRADRVMFTATSVRLAPDLRNATVLVSIYPETSESLAMHALRHAAAHIRHQVADLVAMKQVPALAFELDASLRKQVEVLDALARIAAERQARAASGDSPASPGSAAPHPADGNNPAEAPRP